jgi:hypothetical protein
MWPVLVGVVTPCRNKMACMAQAVEQVFIDAFVAHPGTEAFHEPILHWLTRCDVVPVNLPVLLPFQGRFAGQFGSATPSERCWFRG